MPLTYDVYCSNKSWNEKPMVRIILRVLSLVILFAVSEYIGLTQAITVTQPGIVELSNIKRVQRYDLEAGSDEVMVLNIRVRYVVDGKEYVVPRQWTSDYWVSNGNFSYFVSRFAQGNKVEVRYLKGFPAHARIVAPLSWFIYIILMVPGCILGIFVVVLIQEFRYRNKMKDVNRKENADESIPDSSGNRYSQISVSYNEEGISLFSPGHETQKILWNEIDLIAISIEDDFLPFPYWYVGNKSNLLRIPNDAVGGKELFFDGFSEFVDGYKSDKTFKIILEASGAMEGTFIVWRPEDN